MVEFMRCGAVALLALALAVTGCGGGGTSSGSSSTPPPATGMTQQPAISSYSPTSGPPGTSITIQGTNLGATAASNAVKINGVQAPVTSASSTVLVVTVPAGASTGKLTVETGSWLITSAADWIVTLPPPTVASFTPMWGKVGSPLTLTGTGFAAKAADNQVWINGYAATVTASTSTTLVVTVPPVATTGKLTVQTAGGTAQSAEAFSVGGTITEFTPAIGLRGSTVTINGTGLGPLWDVYFGDAGRPAQVQEATATSLTVTVPDGAAAGANLLSLQPRSGNNAVGVRSDLDLGTKFTVLSPSAPTITRFTPAYGPAGTRVTVYGTNFSNLLTDNAVKFNGVAAAVTAVSASAEGPFLWVTVPAGASGSGPLTIATREGAATSPDSFFVQETPPPSQPTASLSPDTLAWGSVTLGGAAEREVVVTNTGSLAVKVSGASVSGSGFSHSYTTCYGYDAQLVRFDTLAPGKTCKFVVQYAPKSVGSNSGTLSFAAAGARRIVLSASGVAPLAPAVLLSATKLTFAALELGATSDAQSVRLSNVGTAALSITDIGASGEFAQSNDCPASLAVGAGCNISVRFMPKRFAEAKLGSLTVSTNAPTRTDSVALSGEGSLAKSGRLALYSRLAWPVDDVYVDGAWVGGGLKGDSQDACGGIGAITLKVAPGAHAIAAYDNLYQVTAGSATVTENGCTTYQIAGTAVCASPNVVENGYCVPPTPPTCVQPYVYQNGACVKPGTSTGTGSGSSGSGGSGGSGGVSGGSNASGTSAQPAVFDSSGGGTGAAQCLRFGLLKSDYGSEHDSQTMTNICGYKIYVLWCHSPSARPKWGADSQCGVEGRFFQMETWLEPGAVKDNMFSLPTDAKIWYGACSGGDTPKGKEVSAEGRYICQ